jgi:hypothetical protein
VETILTETTHYTVSATNSDYTAGGAVATVTTYDSGNTITLLRNMAITQESDFVEGMPTLYGTFEDALDKLIRICQQLYERLNRTVILNPSSPYYSLDLPDPVAGYYVRWKNDLSGFENVDQVTANGSTQATGGFYKSTMSGDEVVTVTGTWITCTLDPNGADRNFDLTVPGDYLAIVHNIGDYAVTFDQSGIGVTIGARDTKIFIYDTDSSVWRG